MRVDGDDGPTTQPAPIVAVLDYGIGNMRSAQKGLERVGVDARLTDDVGLIADAAAVVLPGVGHFGTCMSRLRRAGLDEVAVDAASSGRPFLGICVGMQMLFEGSEEAPGVEGLGVFPGISRLIPGGLPRPQMQWNKLDLVGLDCPLLAGLSDDIWMYFVHSYAAETEADYVVATCDYGADLTAMVQRDGSVWATQFHPEKSGERGRELAANFVAAIGVVA